MLPGVRSPIEHRWVDVGDVTLHVALAGPEEGPPLVLLHGFPEAWFGWEHQIDALVDAGIRVIMPDQRGYNLSERPGRVADYAVDRLAADIVGLVRALGHADWHLAGHDWGAAVAWELAFDAPAGLSSVSILNVPEPSVLLKAALSSRQGLRSWYMVAFQVPVLPEAFLLRDGAAPMARGLEGSARPGVFGDEALARYRTAWCRPGALTAMIAWYRAALRRPRPRPASARVRLPMQILWGEQDAFLGAELVDPSAARCDNVQVIRFPDATHWVQHEEASAVSVHLVEHVQRNAVTR